MFHYISTFKYYFATGFSHFQLCTPLKMSFKHQGHREHMNTYHLLRRLGSPSIVCTILAPLMGGFEYMGRTMILSCDITRSFSSAESQTTVKAPALSPVTQIHILAQFVQIIYNTKTYCYQNDPQKPDLRGTSIPKV